MNSPGLRERKKQRTRWAIQEHALRLFAENGYEATTVDQIAAAAEISPSTFFRYFPTKEDLVVQDQYDDLLAAAMKAAPAELGPVGAIRAAAEAFREMPPAEEAAPGTGGADLRRTGAAGAQLRERGRARWTGCGRPSPTARAAR